MLIDTILPHRAIYARAALHESAAAMPQQKKTAPIEAAELPDITPQQQEFVRLVISGKTSTDAYKAAYDCNASSQRTIWAEASRLRNNPDVAAWIDAAKIAGMASCAVTYQSHIDELERLKTIAVKTGNIGAAVQAEQIRGKAAGLHVEQVRDVTQRNEPDDLLRDIAATSPAAAAALAAEHGIELPAAGTTRH